MAVSITTKMGDATTAQADALIVPVGAGAALGDGITKAFDGQLAGLLEATGFGGKRGEVVAYPTFGKLGARTLVLTALGERTAEPGRWGEALRRAYGAAVTRARDEGAKHVAVALPEDADAEAVGAIVEGLTLALYRYTRYKTGEAAAPKKHVASIELWSGGAIPSDAVAHGQAVAAGVELTRDLVNTISNDKTPPQIAELAREVATQSELGYKAVSYTHLTLPTNREV